MKEQRRCCHTDISLPSVQLRCQMHKCYAAHGRREEGTRLLSESPVGKVRSEVQVIMARCPYCFCQDMSLSPGSRGLRVPSVLLKTPSPVSLTQAHLLRNTDQRTQGVIRFTLNSPCCKHQTHTWRGATVVISCRNKRPHMKRNAKGTNKDACVVIITELALAFHTGKDSFVFLHCCGGLT